MHRSVFVTHRMFISLVLAFGYFFSLGLCVFPADRVWFYLVCLMFVSCRGWMVRVVQLVVIEVLLLWAVLSLVGAGARAARRCVLVVGDSGRRPVAVGGCGGTARGTPGGAAVFGPGPPAAGVVLCVSVCGCDMGFSGRTDCWCGCVVVKGTGCARCLVFLVGFVRGQGLGGGDKRVRGRGGPAEGGRRKCVCLVFCFVAGGARRAGVGGGGSQGCQQWAFGGAGGGGHRAGGRGERGGV